eukprot:SAG11_NODE_36714_length_260_cov_0.645963_2_plen_54_part_01
MSTAGCSHVDAIMRHRLAPRLQSQPPVVAAAAGDFDGGDETQRRRHLCWNMRLL